MRILLLTILAFFSSCHSSYNSKCLLFSTSEGLPIYKACNISKIILTKDNRTKQTTLIVDLKNQEIVKYLNLFLNENGFSNYMISVFCDDMQLVSVVYQGMDESSQHLAFEVNNLSVEALNCLKNAAHKYYDYRE